MQVHSVITQALAMANTLFQASHHLLQLKTRQMFIRILISSTLHSE